MTTQINIKNDSGQNIVGILEKKSSNGTLGEKLVIICHGSAGKKQIINIIFFFMYTNKYLYIFRT